MRACMCLLLVGVVAAACSRPDPAPRPADNTRAESPRQDGPKGEEPGPRNPQPSSSDGGNAHETPEDIAANRAHVAPKR